MDVIIQIATLGGYTAVFERSRTPDPASEPDSEPAPGPVPGRGILAQVDEQLVHLEVLFFALVRSRLPAGGEMYRLVGVVLDPDYGYLGLCEHLDGQSVYPGRFLGYLPPGGSRALAEAYRWMVAARLDGRLATEAAWRELVNGVRP